MVERVRRESQAGVDAWNRGDIRAFLAPYAADVLVVHRSGPERGLAALEAQLRRAQPWAGRPGATARLAQTHVSCPAARLALQTALIEMTIDGRSEAIWMTSLWERRLDRWRVVHEQSF